MSWGLLSGLGKGMEKGMDTIADQLRQERVFEYNQAVAKQGQEFQKEMKQDDRAYQEKIRGDELARASAEKVVRQEEMIDPDTNKLITVSYGKDKDGNEIELQRTEKVREKDEKARWKRGSDGVMYDQYSGETRGEPSPGAAVTSQQISAAKSILSQYKNVYEDEMTPAQKAEVQQAKSIIQKAAGISPGSAPEPPVTEDPLYQEAQVKAEQWADDQAGWLSTDDTDFKQYGGNRQEAIQQKTMEYYNQMKGGGGGLLSQGIRQETTKTPRTQSASGMKQVEINGQKYEARQAPDGNYYVEIDGQFYKVDE